MKQQNICSIHMISIGKETEAVKAYLIKKNSKGEVCVCVCVGGGGGGGGVKKRKERKKNEGKKRGKRGVGRHSE